MSISSQSKINTKSECVKFLIQYFEKFYEKLHLYLDVFEVLWILQTKFLNLTTNSNI